MNSWRGTSRIAFKDSRVADAALPQLLDQFCAAIAPAIHPAAAAFARVSPLRIPEGT